MTEKLLIRRARVEDAPDIARLILCSAESFMPALFGPGIVPALEALAASRGTLFSHEHARVAEEGGRALGMILGYTGAVKAAQDPKTGLCLFLHLGMDMIRRLGSLVRMQAAIGNIGRDEFYISNVAVYSEHRGKGIGARLIDGARREARLSGVRAAVLDVETDNVDGIRLYERLGFRTESRTPEIELGGRTFAFLRMSLPLETETRSPRLDSL